MKKILQDIGTYLTGTTEKLSYISDKVGSACVRIEILAAPGALGFGIFTHSQGYKVAGGLLFLDLGMRVVRALQDTPQAVTLPYRNSGLIGRVKEYFESENI